MASPEVLGSVRAAFGVVVMLFLVPGTPSVGYCLPETLGAAATLRSYDSRRARRFLAATDVAGGDGAPAPHFTMLLMMLGRAATRGWRKY